MEKKIPLNIGLEILVNPDVVRFNEFRFISPHFGFVNSFAKIESNLITVDQPYRIKEGRIAVIKQGYARVLINLIEETFQPDAEETNDCGSGDRERKTECGYVCAK